jgi:hypothetical protein
MRRAVVTTLGLVVTGCAALQPYQPTVDLAGANPAIYQDDLVACRNKVNGLGGSPIAGGPILVGAVIGASFGLGLAGVMGDFGVVGNYAAAEAIGGTSGAAAGGAIGAAIGNTAPVESASPSQPLPPGERQAAIDQCLRGDGYKLVSWPQ